ncbi:unnamed protein product [Chrysodeixis includens]|uniref:C2H2-type domain-containing protein n=1 Tax=Chrysodeixis includens TaxID=689277 RepID=A0A9P0BTK8_CHRIL|nr:unnamed protein product [Chrysodeixis includens]
MGAKPPDQLNLRRPNVKCDICGRKFMNATALKSHHKCLHLKPDGKRSIKKGVDTKPLKKKVVPVSMLKRVAPAQASKQVNKTEVKGSSSLPGKKATTDKRPKFECPVCAAIFAVYFSAFRHIQKNHCVDANGEKVSPHSPDLIKPIRQEYCMTCDKQIRSTDTHVCVKPTLPKDFYKCYGCDQIFSSLAIFQHHIKGLHDDGVQNYFLPSKEDFTAWKKDLEDQTELSFVKLNNMKSKDIYHCSYQPVDPTAVSHFCPSMISVRNYKSGVHVTYHKDHFGHVIKPADLEKYSNHLISSLKNDEEMKLDSEEDCDLYIQFRKLVTNVVNDAAKVDVATLRDLFGKALEMTTILKCSDNEERGLPIANKILTDAQISSNLESMKTKRKHSPVPKDAKKDVKKVKKDGEDKFENGIYKAKSPTLNKSASFKSKKNDTEKIDDVSKLVLQSPTSFNESYKNFVDQNFKLQPDASTPKPRSYVRKKEVVKTKIGQFKVKPSSLSPKETILNDSLPKEVPVSPNRWKLKPDFKYEVKEQENDCNILILKI